jgi:membrane-associated phospholipid phosphatase
MDNDQQVITRTGRAIWAIVGLLLTAVSVGSWNAALSLDLASGIKAGLVIALCIAISLFYRHWRKDPWIAIGAESSAQLACIMMLGMLLAYPLATLDFPYRDAQLHQLDLWLGLDWGAYLRFATAHPLFSLIGKAAYWSMGTQALLVVIVLTASSKFLRLRQYIIAITIALLTTLVIFTFAPAGGAYFHLHVATEEYAGLDPAVTFGPVRHLEALRAGSRFLISSDNLEGLVAFPSFHTECGVLFTWALFAVPRLRWWVAALNALLIAAAPIEGAHYFIDLIAGLIVAPLAIYSAGLFTARMRLKTTAQFELRRA